MRVFCISTYISSPVRENLDMYKFGYAVGNKINVYLIKHASPQEVLLGEGKKSRAYMNVEQTLS